MGSRRIFPAMRLAHAARTAVRAQSSDNRNDVFIAGVLPPRDDNAPIDIIYGARCVTNVRFHSAPRRAALSCSLLRGVARLNILARENIPP